MSLPEEKHANSPYTYTDYLGWDEDVRAEIIDGKLIMMAPPLRQHQGISRNLLLKIGNFLEGKPCKIYAAPFGVRLFPQKDKNDDTVLEPDLVVVYDQSKLDDRGCNGPPDMIVEILSSATAQRDMLVKFRKYLQAGVREYWIVDGGTKTIHVCVLHDNQYRVSVYGEGQNAPISVLPGCEIDLKSVFAE
jgi:Uma2 family endonuclease